MLKKFKLWLESRRLMGSRAKVARMIVGAAKRQPERSIIDTQVQRVSYWNVGCVAVSYGYADGLVWPSKEGAALPMEALNDVMTVGRGNAACVVHFANTK